METIKEKYIRIRPFIKQGDLILFHGRKPLARIIQQSDSKAYFNHVGVIGEIAGSFFIIDSNAPGVKPDRLSDRVYSYENGDFLIIRSEKSKKEITNALKKLLKKADQVKYKYDYINGGKALFNRWFGTKFKIKLDPYRKICSEFTLPYAVELEVVFPYEEIENNLFFPQDYIRRSNKVIMIGVNE